MVVEVGDELGTQLAQGGSTHEVDVPRLRIGVRRRRLRVEEDLADDLGGDDVRQVGARGVAGTHEPGKGTDTGEGIVFFRKHARYLTREKPRPKTGQTTQRTYMCAASVRASAGTCGVTIFTALPRSALYALRNAPLLTCLDLLSVMFMIVLAICSERGSTNAAKSD